MMRNKKVILKILIFIILVLFIYFLFTTTSILMYSNIDEKRNADAAIARGYAGYLLSLIWSA